MIEEIEEKVENIVSVVTTAEEEAAVAEIEEVVEIEADAGQVVAAVAEETGEDNAEQLRALSYEL